MEVIEQFYEQLDNSTWDANDIHEIESVLKKLKDSLDEEGNNQVVEFDREIEAFAFSKFPDKKLSFKFAGERTLEDGSKIPFEWPDINRWKKSDFEYIHQRFSTCKNQFAKSEYGLLLFYKGKLKPDECLQLFYVLFDLAKIYYNDSISIVDSAKSNSSVFSFYNALHNAIYVAYFKLPANKENFKRALKEAFLFVEEIHSNWKKVEKYMLRTTIDMTELVVKYCDASNPIVRIEGFISRNNEAIEEQNKTYTWGAIYILDENIKLCKAANIDFTYFIKRKAELYEKLFEEAKATRLMAAINFIETSLNLYKEINEVEKAKELEAVFQKIRNDARLGEIKQELPEEYNRNLMAVIKQNVEGSDEKGIVLLLCICPMFYSVEKIKVLNEQNKSASVFASSIPSYILDKNGNTVDAFITESEREEFRFWQTYTFQFQIGVQTLQAFFIEAYKANKISYSSIETFVLASWIGKKETRFYHGKEEIFCLADTILPSIRELFRQLDIWKNSNEQPELTIVIDSLVLKIEKVLREFCKNVGLTIFKDVRKKGNHELKNEKNIDDLLRDLKEQNTGFTEDDRVFIQYILTEKAGQNLRHKVAHGLMDKEDYALHYALLCMVIILKISAYKIKSNEHIS